MTNSEILTTFAAGFVSGLSLWAVGYVAAVLRRAADMVGSPD